MPSLFNPADAQVYLNRIGKLTPGSAPLWGKMNVTQMLLHMQGPLKVALGEMQLKRGMMGILFGGLAKRQLLKPGPLSKNMPTAKEFLMFSQDGFEAAREELITLIERFTKGGPVGLTKEPHPFFGKLSSVEWDTLQWKHLDHHLRQFGV
jgi:hypothetical protein